MSSKRNQFSIDDAFEEENTDSIKVYGTLTTTTERSPLKPPRWNGTTNSDDAVSIHIHDPIIRGSSNLKIGDDTISKDSDSLITESPDNYDPTTMPWWLHPKVRENYKMVLAAFLLLIIGLGLSIAGLSIILIPINGLQGAVFLVAGLICLIPGAYHVVYIFLAVKGKRGYDFYHLPLFN